MPKSPLTDVVIPEVPLHEVLLDAMVAYSDKTALIDGVSGKRYKYKDVIKHIRSVASGLHRLGVHKGDVLAMFSPNTPEFVFMFFGAIAAGATVTTINPAYTSYEVKRHLEDSGATWVYSLAELSAIVFEAARSRSELKEVILLGGTDNCVPFQKLFDDDGTSYPNVKINPREDVAVIPYSSGTTGLPKGVMLTHYNYMANVSQYTHAEFMDHDHMNAEQAPVLLGLLPFFHSYGMMCIMCLGLYAGYLLVTLPRFDPSLFLRTIEKYKVTLLRIVPPTVVFMAKHPMVAEYDLSSVTTVWCGAAPLAKDIEIEFKKRLNLEDMKQGYGMTEMTCIGTAQPLSKPIKPGSSGVPIPNTEMKVVDPATGKELGPLERGEVWMKGPNLMKGYLNNPEATHSTIDKDGWLHTGDVGYYDEDNYFYFVDRIKELIKYKAFQVAPAELEALLMTHPKVADVGVVGVPDVSAGELPRAYVVIKEDVTCTEEEIKQFVAERLVKYKHLTGGVEFVATIPKNPSGKILRRKLREMITTSKI